MSNLLLCSMYSYINYTSIGKCECFAACNVNKYKESIYSSICIWLSGNKANELLHGCNNAPFIVKSHNETLQVLILWMTLPCGSALLLHMTQLLHCVRLQDWWRSLMLLTACWMNQLYTSLVCKKLNDMLLWACSLMWYVLLHQVDEYRNLLWIWSKLIVMYGKCLIQLAICVSDALCRTLIPDCILLKSVGSLNALNITVMCDVVIKYNDLDLKVLCYSTNWN